MNGTEGGLARSPSKSMRTATSSRDGSKLQELRRRNGPKGFQSFQTFFHHYPGLSKDVVPARVYVDARFRHCPRKSALARPVGYSLATVSVVCAKDLRKVLAAAAAGRA